MFCLLSIYKVFGKLITILSIFSAQYKNEYFLNFLLNSVTINKVLCFGDLFQQLIKLVDEIADLLSDHLVRRKVTVIVCFLFLRFSKLLYSEYSPRHSNAIIAFHRELYALSRQFSSFAMQLLLARLSYHYEISYRLDFFSPSTNYFPPFMNNVKIFIAKIFHVEDVAGIIFHPSMGAILFYFLVIFFPIAFYFDYSVRFRQTILSNYRSAIPNRPRPCQLISTTNCLPTLFFNFSLFQSYFSTK